MSFVLAKHADQQRATPAVCMHATERCTAASRPRACVFGACAPPSVFVRTCPLCPLAFLPLRALSWQTPQSLQGLPKLVWTQRVAPSHTSPHSQASDPSGRWGDAVDCCQGGQTSEAACMFACVLACVDVVLWCWWALVLGCRKVGSQ